MKAQILYASMSGHSKKVAEAIAKNTGISAYNLKDKPQLLPCDLLFIISGIYAGEVKPELLEYAKSLSKTQVKKVALITSSTRGSSQGSLRATLIKAGIEVVEEEYLFKGNFLIFGLGHPNQSEIHGAVAFAKRLLND